jgi:hypothetical protein
VARFDGRIKLENKILSADLDIPALQVDAALDLSHTQNIGRMIKAHFPQSQVMCSSELCTSVTIHVQLYLCVGNSVSSLQLIIQSSTYTVFAVHCCVTKRGYVQQCQRDIPNEIR